MDNFDKSLSNSAVFTALREEFSDLRQVKQQLEGEIAALDRKISVCRRDLETGLQRLDKGVDRLEIYSNDMSKIKAFFDEIMTELRQKASQQDLLSVETSLHAYCPLQFAEKLQKALNSKASLVTVDQLASDFGQLSAAVYTDFTRKSDLIETVQRCKDEIQQILTGYATDSVCFQRSRESSLSQQPRIREITENVTILNRQSREMAAYIEDIKSNMLRKAGFDALDEVKERFKAYARIADYNDVRKEMEEFEEKCRMEMEDMIGVLKGQDEILARYDEVLLEKASKVDIQKLQERLRAYCKSADVESRLSSLDFTLETLSSTSSTHGQLISMLESSLSDVLQAARMIKGERRDYGQLKEMIEELHSRKADKVDLVQMVERKASADEFHQTLQCVDILHRLMKMCAVLICHCFKRVTNSRNAELARREWLTKHAEMVVKWANEFSPLQPDLKLPDELWMTPTPSHSPLPQSESPNFSTHTPRTTHRRLRTRPIKLPSIDSLL